MNTKDRETFQKAHPDLGFRSATDARITEPRSGGNLGELTGAFAEARPADRAQLGEAMLKALAKSIHADANTEAAPDEGIAPGITLRHLETGLDVRVLRDWGGSFTVQFPDGHLGIYDARRTNDQERPGAM